MLKSLKIKNYALIKKVELDFSKGMTVITGETGAGKSIILGALGLILGKRADSKSLFNKEKKCVVEASFLLKNEYLKSFFKSHELDYEEETIIRRELLPSGKSRSFINDSPVNLKTLGQLSAFLIDLHQQFDTLDIHQIDFHVQVVDAIADNKILMQTYLDQYKRYKMLRKRKEELENAQAESLREKDFVMFQLKELLEANLESGEQQGLEKEIKILENAGDIKQTLSGIYGQLAEHEGALLGQMETLRVAMGPVRNLSEDLEGLSDRFNTIYFELQELSNDFERVAEGTDIDGERLKEIRERLDVLYRLQNKHFVSDDKALLDVQEALQEKLNGFVNLDADLEEVVLELEQLHSTLLKLSEELRKKRNDVIPAFEDQVRSNLGQLSMNYARFEVRMNVLEEPGPSGMDAMEFFFNANKGGELKKIKDVASGGELSRLTLVIKSLVASAIPLPTMIFDEIDTGISGDVALKMGIMLERLASEHQIVSITHSPQIGSKGKLHYFVFKEVGENQTYSNIRKLNVDERVDVLAIMLSQDPPSKGAIENAKELLAN
ncbi:MAG: DNA repair protein RecN [Saprospiraceae bacterium]|nr:DNA repair protein RecN [Saprospiraceae bacterium]